MPNSGRLMNISSRGANRVPRRWCPAVAVGLLLAAAASVLQPAPAAEPAPCPIQFRDVTSRSGVTFRHTDGSSGRRYIVETVTAGMATFDYDGDGLIDIYFVNGAPLPGSAERGPMYDALYRNMGDGTFRDVTQEAGVGDPGYGLGVAAADYDNDGDQDLYISNFGPNALYRNNGDGTFTRVEEQAGVRRGGMVGAGVVFLDADGDADLDLYVANYVRFTFENHVETIVDGHPQYSGPKLYEPDPDIFYRNDGDGTFTDASEESGIAAHAGTGMGIVALDYDNDADTDIAVLNDVRGNFFFENDGRGRFEEVGLANGFSYNVDGMELGSMGIDCADYNNDGWLDLYQTSYSNELPALYRNSGAGFFEEVIRSSGAGIGAYPHVNWGVGFADFDNDGDRDLFLANGHLQDNVHIYDDTTSYEVRNLILMNTDGERFVNVSDRCGDGLAPRLSSRGAALDDFDNDGRVDIAILNSRREATLLRNESATDHHWLEIRLQGVLTNRDGVGARVTVVSGGRSLIDEVHSGRGYQGHFGTRLYFGLGKSDKVDRVEIRWIGGGTDVVPNPPVDRLITIAEGLGLAP